MQDLDRVREIALKRLSRRGHSRAELVERLTGRGFARPLVEAVAADLQRVGLLDDEAYGRDVAERLLARAPATADFVRAALEARGVEPGPAERIAEQAVGATDPLVEAVRFADAKMRARSGSGSGGGGEHEAARRRIGTALARRGFDPDIIESALEHVGLGPRELDA